MCRQEASGIVKGTAGTRQILCGSLKNVVQSLKEIEVDLSSPVCGRSGIASSIIAQQFIHTHLDGERRQCLRNRIQRRCPSVLWISSIKICSRRTREKLSLKYRIMGIRVVKRRAGKC